MAFMRSSKDFVLKLCSDHPSSQFPSLIGGYFKSASKKLKVFLSRISVRLAAF